MKNGILQVSSKMYDDITCVNFWIIQWITAAFLFDVVHLYQDYLIIYLNSFIIYEYASNVNIMGLIKLQWLRWKKNPICSSKLHNSLLIYGGNAIKRY